MKYPIHFSLMWKSQTEKGDFKVISEGNLVGLFFIYLFFQMLMDRYIYQNYLAGLKVNCFINDHQAIYMFELFWN